MPMLKHIPRLHLLDKVVLTVAEVCAITGFCQTAIYADMKSGKLPAHRRPGGRMYIVLRQDLDAYLAALPKVPYRETVGEKGGGDEKPLRLKDFCQ
jgi:excisionase family DNA binding protein